MPEENSENRSAVFACALWLPPWGCVRIFFSSRDERLPERGTSGSVQRGPANPARPGREQRYRDHLGCCRSPEVPLTEESSEIRYQVSETKKTNNEKRK